MRRSTHALFALLCACTAGGLTPVWSAEEPASSGEDLARRSIERRAVEAAIWGMPAVNFDLMYQAMAQAGGSWNQIVYWSRPLGWENQTLTPNSDTIYVFPFINTKYVGPVVRRRFGRRLLRAQGAGGRGVELGSHEHQ